MQLVRALATWSGAFAGLMLTLVGSLIPAAMLWPGVPLEVLPLPSTWQVPALLICALVCGPRAGVIASVAYLTIGLVDLPVFHDGGGPGYLLNPGFGYLAGFVPAAWLCGRLSQQEGMNDLARLTLAAIAGLVMIQICGLLNLLVGGLLGRWADPLPELLFSYGVGPLPSQLALCVAAALLALPLRRLLLIE
jgi:biotin transport system substrate-specific component|tara:strand:- start:277 stop:852 length:576 start_codon:yes stop_codon:yes gene_type:complete